MARRDRRRDCRRGSAWSPGPASPLRTRLAWGRHAAAGGGGSGSTAELHFLWGRGGDGGSLLGDALEGFSGAAARGGRETGGRAARSRSLGAGGCALSPRARLRPARRGRLLPAAPHGQPRRAPPGGEASLWNFAADFLPKVMEMGGWWSVAEMMPSCLGFSPLFYYCLLFLQLRSFLPLRFLQAGWQMAISGGLLMRALASAAPQCEGRGGG